MNPCHSLEKDKLRIDKAYYCERTKMQLSVKNSLERRREGRIKLFLFCATPEIEAEKKRKSFGVLQVLTQNRVPWLYGRSRPYALLRTTGISS